MVTASTRCTQTGSLASPTCDPIAGGAVSLGWDQVICVVVGALTAPFGGIIRDVLAGEPSILLRRELYITPAIVSASVFIVLRTLGLDWTWASSAAVVLGFVVRAGGIRW